MIKKTMTLSLLLVLVSGCATPSRLKKYGLEMYEKGGEDALTKIKPMIEKSITQRDQRIESLRKSLSASEESERSLKDKIDAYFKLNCLCKHKGILEIK